MDKSSPPRWFHFQKIWFCICWNMLFPLGQEKQEVNFTVKDIYVLIMSSRQSALRKQAITKCIVKWLSSAFCVKSVQAKMWYSFRVSFFPCESKNELWYLWCFWVSYKPTDNKTENQFSEASIMVAFQLVT